MRYYTDPQILMDDIRGGRSEAFEYLFKTYYPRLRSYASHFIADVDDTEDIVQDCFTRLWERRETLTLYLPVGSSLHDGAQWMPELPEAQGAGE